MGYYDFLLEYATEDQLKNIAKMELLPDTPIGEELKRLCQNYDSLTSVMDVDKFIPTHMFVYLGRAVINPVKSIWINFPSYNIKPRTIANEVELDLEWGYCKNKRYPSKIICIDKETDLCLFLMNFNNKIKYCVSTDGMKYFKEV